MYLYCMDNSGLEGGQWRPATNLFTNKSLDALTGQYEFQLPDCGPVAYDGAIRLVALSTAGGVPFQEVATCYFKILRSLFIAPRLPAPPTTTTISTEPFRFTFPEPTTTSSANVIPTTTENLLPPSPPPTTTNNQFPSPTENLRIISPTPDQGTSAILPSNTSPTALPTTSESLPSSSSSPSVPGIRVNVSQRVPSSGHSPAPTPLPLPVLPDGNKGSFSDSEAGVNSTKIKTITAALGSIGTAACLAIVILSLLVIRRRRKRFGRTDPGKSVARSLGGAGVDAVIMKQKRRIRLRRQPKEGYFYQIENDDDDDKDSVDEYLDIEMQRGENGTSSASAERLDMDMTMATMSHMTASSVNGASGLKNSTIIGIDRTVQSARTSLHAPIAIPSLVHLEPSPASTPRQRYSTPFTDSASQTYTMSSMRSSVETSSVIRQYWAASMAARIERHEDGHLTPTRGLGDGAGSSYEEGSIFGDGSRSSESRMADIVSMRTTGTGVSSGYHYRRSTLNSFGGLSSDPSRTMTMSLSSIPDSLMISEDEFLERLQMQSQLEQEYYSRYYGHDPGYYDLDYHNGSMMSRRTSSVQSLTSSNDPFKTFDSNEEILADDEASNPFTDDRALSRVASHVSQRSFPDSF
ncbi:hypothetical protein BGZ50_004511 [Haplosporangium sp. Z 11]|nr:hypothetical protein BGZ50_004511 [Haplosporangium sp. Z 11]